MAHMMTRMTRWLDSHDSLARWLAVLSRPPGHAVCCEDNYFPKRKFKLFNSFFHSVYLAVSIRLFSIADLFAVR